MTNAQGKTSIQPIGGDFFILSLNGNEGVIYSQFCNTEEMPHLISQFVAAASFEGVCSFEDSPADNQAGQPLHRIFPNDR